MNRGIWQVIDEGRGVLWGEYEFRKGAFATTLVLRGVEGLVVVSPGSGLSPADLDALGEFGEVRALVANNSFHYLGQAAWRARFPGAESYAAGPAAAKLAQKSGLPFRAVGELALPSYARIEALPGCNNGELLVRVGTARGSVWYTGDLLTNIQRTPGPPLRWLFTLTGSAPGFRLFRLGVWAFVRDRPALRERLLALVGEDPPALIVPAHGPAYEGPGLADEVRAQLARL